MEVLSNWKRNGGKGRFHYEDIDEHHAVLSNLVSGLVMNNFTLTLVSKSKSKGYYSHLLNFPVIGYDEAGWKDINTFCLVLIDADSMPTDYVNLLLWKVKYKYLFATIGKSLDKEGDLFKVPYLSSNNNKTKRAIDFKYNETNLILNLSEKDTKDYDEITNKMNEIFESFNGDLNTIINCYRGDMKSGITADVFRNEFAKSMGWHKNLNVNIEYYKQINEIYNPNAIYERAKLYNELIALRNHFLDEHFKKVISISRILSYFKNKRFLIVCKNSKMADRIVDFISKTEDVIRAIHNDHKNIYLKDETGELIVYKSGAKEGQPKGHGATTVNKVFNDMYNNGDLRAICITNAVPKKAVFQQVDAIIYTSPKALSYQELSSRVRIEFTGAINVFNLVLHDTKDVDNYKDSQKARNVYPKNFNESDIDKLKLY